MKTIMKTRIEQIEGRRLQIPKLYRAVYNRAVSRGGLRSVVNAQCLECAGWVRDEITECTDLACPLWLKRPYQTSDVPSAAVKLPVALCQSI